MKTLDSNERNELAEKIAKRWTNTADMKEVLSYYYNAQMEYLSDLSDDELLDLAQEEINK